MAAILQMTYSSAFFDRTYSYFDSNLNDICSYGPNWQYVSIGSDNG